MERGPWGLRTARLDLEPITRAHAAEMYAVLAEPALYVYTGGQPPSSIDAVARWFEGWERRRSPDGAELWLNWVVRERASGQAAGYVQATLADQRADLAWVLGTPWQGRGYATEAARAVQCWLQELGVARFRACVRPDHPASQRVAAGLGMARTADWIDGEEVWVREERDRAPMP